MGEVGSDSFVLLSTLAAALRRPSPAMRTAALTAVRRLGPTAVPLLVRHLDAPHQAQRTLLRDIARALAEPARDRLRGALAEAIRGGADSTKAAAQCLLAELGAPVPAAARFDDAVAIQRRTARQLAAQLGSAADVAAAAELMISRLDPGELVAIAMVMLEQAPDVAPHLVRELAGRPQLGADVRASLLRAVAPLPAPTAWPMPRVRWQRRLVGPDGAEVLARVGAGARAVALHVDARGVLTSGWYDDGGGVARLQRELLAPLARDGYALAPELDPRPRLAAAAAAATRLGLPLPSAYYLGRDLFGLTCEHLGARAPLAPASLLHGLGVDRLAARDAAGARSSLERAAAMAPDDADVAASLGLCLLALGDAADATRWLGRARTLDPRWPMHHWNHAAAALAAGATADGHASLRAYVRAVERSPAGATDEHRARRAQAIELVGEQRPPTIRRARTLPHRRRLAPT